ncbi:unnamed protein product, partial [Polarella glacialis]
AMVPQGDGLSETSRALLRKYPAHVSRGLGDPHNTAATTSAQQRADMTMALMYTKGRMQPSGGATSSSGFGSVSPSRLEAPIWPKEFQNDSQKGLSSFREPPKACAAFLMGYGDLDTMEGFPGAPAASRGFPGG